jgi:hypothetical protein
MAVTRTRQAEERPAVARARAFAFVVVLAWIVGAPFYRQVLGGENAHARAWVMFRGSGLGVVDARFYERRPDGSLRSVDRYAELGQRRPVKRATRRLLGEAAVRTVVRRLCRRLGAGADVRVVARVAEREGWRPLFDGEENLCRPRTPASPPGEERSPP